MHGVIAHLKRTHNEEITLVLDDVISDNQLMPRRWETSSFFTSISYDSDSTGELRLTKEQYAMIGENLIIRLLSLGDEAK